MTRAAGRASTRCARTGSSDAAIETFRDLYTRCAGGRDRAAARVRDRAARRSADARRAPGARRRRARGARRDGRAQAQRRARHEHGDDAGEVAAGGQGRADVPRHHRRARCSTLRAAARRAAAARAHELLRHARRLARGARAATPSWRPTSPPTSCRTRSRSCVADGLRAGRRGRDEPGARVGAARPRRRLPGARRARGCSTRCSSAATATRFISNSDNLGAVLDPRILAWIAREEMPFLMEVADRTEADRKGGHLARRRVRRRAGAARDRADARRGPRRASRTSRATASSTRTTCGSTCARCAR